MNGLLNPDTPWWDPVDDEGRMKTGGMNLPNVPEWLVDFMPGVGDAKAFFYDMPRSLKDAYNAPTPLGKAGHLGLGLLAGASALPIAGVPMDFLRKGAERARKARMKKEGFDTTVYHGTHQPEGGEAWTHLEPSTMGNEGPGIYTTTDPATADYYALKDKTTVGWGYDGPSHDYSGYGGSSRIYPGVVRGDKMARIQFDPLEGPNAHNLKAYNEMLEKYGKELELSPGELEEVGFLNVLPMDNRRRERVLDIWRDWLIRRNKHLQDLGYEGVAIGPPGVPTNRSDIVLVFEPKNVKSPNAQFRDMNSKDMLANWVPGLLGAGMTARAVTPRSNNDES